MKGILYIAGTYVHPDRRGRRKGAPYDNDPHFYSSPPTWGICRPDLRARALPGDHVFFVLPRRGILPQMIFAHMRIAEIISHHEAFRRAELHGKRMMNIHPEGNIIVDKDGGYNEFDGGAHKRNFIKIQRCYAIGDPNQGRLLSVAEIQRKAPEFLGMLSTLLGSKGERAIDHISRKGRVLTAAQTRMLLDWLG